MAKRAVLLDVFFSTWCQREHFDGILQQNRMLGSELSIIGCFAAYPVANVILNFAHDVECTCMEGFEHHQARVVM